MKTIIILVCVFFLLFTIACGNNKIINGKEYETYGLINKDEVRNPNIKYKPIWGNIIWGCVLAETIIAPIYFFGFSMFEPIKENEK